MATQSIQTAGPPTSELDALRQALAGRYTVERELGRGGMGVVVLAHDLALDRPVAIKLFPPALAAERELRERFLREVRMAASLSHPNIVSIYSVEDRGSLVWYVMAYVDGETLAERVRRTGPLEPAVAARVLQEAAWGLGYAHSRGIVHRDVKPDNILIERATGRTYVTDFGIARLADAPGMTRAGIVLGTPHFMSPEQAAGEPVDGRSDIYSLGVVGYVALTGQVPFDAPTVQAILAKHLTQPAPPVASVMPGVPAALAAVVDRCLAKDPAARYATGEEVVAALENARVTHADVAFPVRMFLRSAEAGMVQVLTLTFLLIALGVNQSHSTAFAPFMWVLFVAVMLLQLGGRARALAAQGYGYEDVAAALAQEKRELQQAQEAARRDPRPRGSARGTRIAITIGLAMTIGGFALGVPSTLGSWQNAVGKLLFLAGALVVMISLALRRSLRQHLSRAAVMANAMWRGRFGRGFFRVATKGSTKG